MSQKDGHVKDDIQLISTLAMVTFIFLNFSSTRVLFFFFLLFTSQRAIYN